MTATFSEEKLGHAVGEAAEPIDDRRGLLRLIGAAVAGGLGPSAEVLAATRGPYKRAFSLDPKALYMNVGTTGAMPTAVVKSLAENLALGARNPRLRFEPQDTRNIIAPSFGADPFELALVLNTTDGMSRILGGLNFRPGDEVITTNMEHPGLGSPLQVAADRFGVVIRRVALPTNDAYSDDEVLARFAAARTERTVAVVFSMIPHSLAGQLPAKAVCAWAAANGLISAVDGAHAPGMIELNLHDLGCDFFAGSGHKWQCGPCQSGFLYVRNKVAPAAPERYSREIAIGGKATTLWLPGYANTTPLPRFFPVLAHDYTGEPGTPLARGSRGPDQNVADHVMHVGHVNYPMQRALQEVCQMWDAWGRKAIEDYVVALAQYARGRIAGIWGPRVLSKPFTDKVAHVGRTGMTTFNPFSPGLDFNAPLSEAESKRQEETSNAVNEALRAEGLVVRNSSMPHSLRDEPARSANDRAADGPLTHSTPLRISTHLFHDTADVDRMVERIAQLAPRP
jgi:selenocysteine lyase/cysteine desulfurase